MAIQYEDGSFSETLPFNELMTQLNNDVENGIAVNALYFGKQNVEKKKNKQELETRISELEQKLEDLSPVKTFLEVPTEDEIRNLGRKAETLFKL